MNSLKDLTWPAALVIVATLGTIVGLVWLGQDLTAVGVVLAGLLGLQVQRTTAQAKDTADIRAQVNGNNEALRFEVTRTKDMMTQMAQEHARTVAQLTAALPPGTPLPQSLSEPVEVHPPQEWK